MKHAKKLAKDRPFCRFMSHIFITRWIYLVGAIFCVAYYIIWEGIFHPDHRYDRLWDIIQVTTFILLWIIIAPVASVILGFFLSFDKNAFFSHVNALLFDEDKFQGKNSFEID